MRAAMALAARLAVSDVPTARTRANPGRAGTRRARSA
jgi:hypothetical protein